MYLIHISYACHAHTHTYPSIHPSIHLYIHTYIHAPHRIRIYMHTRTYTSHTHRIHTAYAYHNATLTQAEPFMVNKSSVTNTHSSDEVTHTPFSPPP